MKSAPHAAGAGVISLLAAAMLFLSVRTAAESLSLPELDGASRTLGDWQGRVVLLDFWATWCAPCIAEVPHLVTLEERYQTKGFSVVSIGFDEADKLRNVVRTLSINYPVLVASPDQARPLLSGWGNKRGIIPYLVLIDRAGHVIATRRGPVDETELDELVELALGLRSQDTQAKLP